MTPAGGAPAQRKLSDLQFRCLRGAEHGALRWVGRCGWMESRDGGEYPAPTDTGYWASITVRSLWKAGLLAGVNSDFTSLIRVWLTDSGRAALRGDAP